MNHQEQSLQLPEAFLIRMKELLGEEYPSFLESYGANQTQGLRLNPLKLSEPHHMIHTPKLRKLEAEFGLRKVPWAAEGYYYDPQTRPGKHVLHEAGLYYIQEPSAMAAVQLLDPLPGEKILDLCGAPGGKTTHIGGRLLGRGLLFANEIHPARARILSQNVERLGVANAVVANEEPRSLAGRFPCFFDRILVDAPCSGEGMFRKDPQARTQWSPDNSATCALRQREILRHAAVMLRPGGRLVYSTCTFSPMENEQVIDSFLDEHPDFSVLKIPAPDGLGQGRSCWAKSRRPDLDHTFRIWPHKSEGEGHYLAVLAKSQDSPDVCFPKIKPPSPVKDRQVKELWRQFAQDTFTDQGLSCLGGDLTGHLALFGEQLYQVPPAMPDFSGLRILRPGLHLGTLKKNRFEPSHALALCLKKEHVTRWESRETSHPDTAAYLRGETLKSNTASSFHQNSKDGWVLMLAQDYSLGWAKQVGDTLKNHYPKGLRLFL